MLKKIFQHFGRHRVILDRENQEPYLERYYLFLKDRVRFPFNIFVHKFLKGDPWDPHDHPWPYFTLILRGGYWEWIPTLDTLGHVYCEHRVWRGPGHFRVCPAGSYHRIELEPGVTPWTLFIPGPHQRQWGFLRNGNQWVPHFQYQAPQLKDNHVQLSKTQAV